MLSATQDGYGGYAAGAEQQEAPPGGVGERGRGEGRRRGEGFGCGDQPTIEVEREEEVRLFFRSSRNAGSVGVDGELSEHCTAAAAGARRYTTRGFCFCLVCGRSTSAGSDKRSERKQRAASVAPAPGPSGSASGSSSAAAAAAAAASSSSSGASVNIPTSCLSTLEHPPALASISQPGRPGRPQRSDQ